MEPILAAPLLRRVDEHLLELLRSLKAEEWELPTIVPGWAVCDVAAHLLDTACRKLSLARDSCFRERVNISSPADLVALVNRLNREGVAVYRRLSPPLLRDLMSIACEQSARFHEELDPFAPAAFGVSWAGEETSLNWFDTARELTERWHHQQQIRLATDRLGGITTRSLYAPVLDCFMRGLPHLYRGVDAPTGTTLSVEITGACGGEWRLTREPAAWSLFEGRADCWDARVSVPEELAWRLFTNGLPPGQAAVAVRREGEPRLADRFLSFTAIVG